MKTGWFSGDGEIVQKLQRLHDEYLQVEPLLSRFLSVLENELSYFVQNHNVTLGVPIESRIKSWNSIRNKIDSKKLELDSVLELDDLVGIRLIMLFKQDVEKMGCILKGELNVLDSEDTGSRLDEKQFGYQSMHYVISPPNAWSGVISNMEFIKLKAECQVRSLSQHIWAVASHKLQYKNESSVPTPLRRSIHRISAVLEIVDIEFDRLMSDRKSYREEMIANPNTKPLDTETLKVILENKWPSDNQSEDQDVEKLLQELRHFGINASDELEDMIDENFDDVMEMEKTLLASNPNSGNSPGPDLQKQEASGVYFTQVDLTRNAIRNKVGNQAWIEFIQNENR